MLKNNKIVKFIILFITVCIYIVNIKATTTTIGDSSELKGVTITKNVTNVTSNVNATFYYKVSEVKSDNPGDIGGIEEDFFIEFDNVEPQNNVASISKSLDLSNLSFSKVGDYYLKICEVSSSNESVYPISDKCFYPLVMVRNELNNNVPTGNLVATLLSTVSDGENKTDAVFETRPMSYITINNKVTGDMSDRDEYFKFKIKINSSNLENIVIKNQDSSVIYNGEEIITSSIYNGNVDNYIYLKHGQSVTIGSSDKNQIPAGLSYVIEEMDHENYKTYINETTTDNKLLEVSMLSNIDSENIQNFTNNYESVTFTGIFTNIVPYLILLFVGIVFFILTRKKYENKQ